MRNTYITHNRKKLNNSNGYKRAIKKKIAVSNASMCITIAMLYSQKSILPRSISSCSYTKEDLRLDPRRVWKKSKWRQKVQKKSFFFSLFLPVQRPSRRFGLYPISYHIVLHTRGRESVECNGSTESPLSERLFLWRNVESTKKNALFIMTSGAVWYIYFNIFFFFYSYFAVNA